MPAALTIRTVQDRSFS